MLRKVRLFVAIAFFSLITLLFLDFTGSVHQLFGGLAKVQFLPAVLSLNVGVILFLVGMTLVLGRIYCSVVCPLGVLQDVISRIAQTWKKNRFTYSRPLSWLRYGVLALCVLAFFAGINGLVELLAPYSSYGRIASSLFAPVYEGGNNVLAHIADKMNNYTFYRVDIWVKGAAVFITAVVTLVAIGVLAWRNGRTYCNTICPVGTVLGFLSRYAYFKPVIEVAKCKNCGMCMKNCKASCIDIKTHTIDYSRCVDCMDCVDKCKFGSITYQHAPSRFIPAMSRVGVSQAEEKEKVDDSLRMFLSVGGLLATSLLLNAKEKKVDGGLAVIEDKKIPDRQTAPVPPGSLSVAHLSKHCTTCQLCISICPNEVLHPSGQLETLMQPRMSYERGYCRPECTQCSEVCPTGAIRPISRAEKTAIQIGHAIWIKKNCVVISDKVSCGNCARHCPTGAIQMVALNGKSTDSLKIPVVNTERCIGCGACENLCPARPFSAIYVEGHEQHRMV